VDLHNEKLYDLYSSPNIIQVIISSTMRWTGQAAHMGDKERRGNLRRKRPFGRPECGWEDNTMTLQQVVWGDMDWIDLDQESVRWLSLVNKAINHSVP